MGHIIWPIIWLLWKGRIRLKAMHDALFRPDFVNWMFEVALLIFIRYVVVNSVKSETLVKWSCQWISEWIFAIGQKLIDSRFSYVLFIEPSWSSMVGAVHGRRAQRDEKGSTWMDHHSELNVHETQLDFMFLSSDEQQSNNVWCSIMFYNLKVWRLG